MLIVGTTMYLVRCQPFSTRRAPTATARGTYTPYFMTYGYKCLQRKSPVQPAKNSAMGGALAVGIWAVLFMKMLEYQGADPYSGHRISSPANRDL
ncbi:uncharacterized protein B0T15DRAFT_537981 [Chaetomium strumarium]|uniref:Uncharacterized protein n=1 Tax=Chaetomium strumarium TaxID=1170767 RepID=A0AAJ0GRQ2_9PEZI|nr:hypothetical protein B0T15DRAFT_537981 [Chaetomium strumarium]